MNNINEIIMTIFFYFFIFNYFMNIFFSFCAPIFAINTSPAPLLLDPILPTYFYKCSFNNRVIVIIFYTQHIHLIYYHVYTYYNRVKNQQLFEKTTIVIKGQILENLDLPKNRILNSK